MSQRQYEVSPAHYTSNVGLGGTGGVPFTWNVASNINGLVHSLQFWQDKHAIRGVEVTSTSTSTDNAGALAGTRAGKCTSVFYFSPGERVTSLKLWANTYYGDGVLSGVELLTDKNRSLIVTPVGKTTAMYAPDVGSGLLVGLFGHSGSALDCLGFAMFHSITIARLIDVSYTGNMAVAHHPAKPGAARTITYDNSSGASAQSFIFAGKETVTTSNLWIITTDTQLNIDFSVEASAPFYSASATAPLQLSVAQMHKNPETKDVEESFNFPLTVPPQKHVRASATRYAGNINLPFTASLLYVLTTGVSLQLTVQGNYNGVASNKMVVTIETGSGHGETESDDL